jgi:hypothetical protein
MGHICTIATQKQQMKGKRFKTIRFDYHWAQLPKQSNPNVSKEGTHFQFQCAGILQALTPFGILIAITLYLADAMRYNEAERIFSPEHARPSRTTHAHDQLHKVLEHRLLLRSIWTDSGA